jgi:heme/copper-type cytochrome/quinol oxidase subunit 4
MSVLSTVHQIFGERVLPLLIVLAAIWFTVTWKPDAPPTMVARLFPVLVDIQVTLGIIYWLYLLIDGNPRMLSFPFILHPLIGLIAAGVAHMAIKGGPFRRLGRWAPLAALSVLLVLVIANVMLAQMT